MTDIEMTHERGIRDIVTDAAKRLAFRDTDASRGAFADQLTEARITEVLSNVDAIRTRARNVYVSVSDGVVTLFGAVRDSGAARDIEQAVRTGARIDAVQNDIHTIGARVSD
jgi:osmotically-inducible protein OsmY